MRHLGSTSWLKPYKGEHPIAVLEMMDDVSSGKVNAALRKNDDVYRLFDSWWYGLGAKALLYLDYADRARIRTAHFLLRASHAPRKIVRHLRASVARP